MQESKGEILNWLESGQFKSLKRISHAFLKGLDLNIDPCNLKLKDQNSIKLICNEFSLDRLAIAKQMHSDDILCIDSSNSNSLLQCDALITQKKNIGLCIKHADCQAALFFDPKKNVIANAHCGWKGSTLNIYSKLIKKMVQNYQCSPKDILVCISPSLGPNSSEFIHYKKEFPKRLWGYEFKSNYFDFWQISYDQLINAGILAENIEISRICTYQNSSDFFSYRKDKTTKRNMSFIALK